MSSYWQEVALGGICQIEIGGTPSRSEDAYWWKSNEDGERLPWVSISDLQERVITNTKEGITRLGLERSNAKRVPQGTLLMSFKLTIGKLALAGRDLYTNEAIASLHTSDSIYPEFLYYGLQYWDLTANTDQAVKGVTLNKQKLQEIPCLLPPLPEQKKIAEILSGIDRWIETLGRQQEKLGTLYKAVSMKCFSEFQERVSLSDVCDLQVGFPFRSSDFQQRGIPLLRGENVGYGKPLWSKTQYLSALLAENYSEYELQNADIVIGMDRSFTKSGFKVSKISKADLPCFLVQRVGRFIPIKIENQFLWHILNSQFYQTQLSKSEKGMDIPHLSKSEILAPKVPLPCPQEQTRIGNALESIDFTWRAVAKAIEKIEQLGKALRSDLLSGRKRVTIQP